jgi:hypothetical protein
MYKAIRLSYERLLKFYAEKMNSPNIRFTIALFGTALWFGITLAAYSETFEKCQFLFKFKKGDNSNRRDTLSILRIKI